MAPGQYVNHIPPPGYHLTQPPPPNYVYFPPFLNNYHMYGNNPQQMNNRYRYPPNNRMINPGHNRYMTPNNYQLNNFDKTKFRKFHSVITDGTNQYIPNTNNYQMNNSTGNNQFTENENQENVLKQVQVKNVQLDVESLDDNAQPKKYKAKEPKSAPSSKKVYYWNTNSFKGHTSEVRDADFSSNGKYRAPCSDDDNAETRAEKHNNTQPKKYKAEEPKWAPSSKKHYSHPWNTNSFKGHTREVLDADFSSNGKYLATCSDDRTVFLWDVKDLKSKDHKSVRVNIDFDHPTFVKWSPDNKAFLIHRYQDGNIEVYKVEKKKGGGLGHATIAHTFPKIHEEEIIGMSISSNGKFIMTCSGKNDLVLWDLKGQVIAKIDTCLMTTFCAKISPCGTFVLASGFSPDAKVWEVTFSKSGEFQDVKRAFELTGHSSGIYDVACNTDSSQMVTVSKDGTWRLFDTKVEYRKGQDPHFIKSGKYKNPDDDSALIALSANGVIVIAVKNNIQFYSAFTGKLDQLIENVYEGKINRILFDATGYYLLTAGYRHVLVFNNVTGYKCDIYSAQEKLKEHQTSATKERLQKIIKDSQAFLDSIPK